MLKNEDKSMHQVNNRKAIVITKQLEPCSTTAKSSKLLLVERNSPFFLA